MKRIIKGYFSFVLLLLFLSVNDLSAQETLGVVVGNVTVNGKTVADAVVTVKLINQNKTSSRSLTEHTDNLGNFTIYVLPHGNYQIETRFSCMKTASENVQINSGKPVKLNIEFIYEDCEKKSVEEEIDWKTCEKTANPSFILTEIDKAELINEVLQAGLIGEESDDYNIPINQPKEIFIDDENIQTNWIKPVPNFKIIALSKKEIQARADKKGDFGYRLFHKMLIQGNCVSVRFTDTLAVGRKHTGTYYGTSSGAYLFLKKNDKWIKKYIQGVIS